MKTKLVASLGALMLLIGCAPLAYQIAPIDAMVVDASTGMPLEGVHVLADWVLERGGLDGAHVTGHLEVKEAITDRNGRFHLDGFVRSISFSQELRNADPRLFFFKSGYQLVRFSNSYPDAGTTTPGLLRKSQINGITLELHRLRDDEMGPNAYATFDSEIRGIAKMDCNWKKFPQLLLTLFSERARLDAKYVREASLPSIQTIEQFDDRSCGSPTQYFESVNR